MRFDNRFFAVDVRCLDEHGVGRAVDQVDPGAAVASPGVDGGHELRGLIGSPFVGQFLVGVALGNQIVVVCGGGQPGKQRFEFRTGDFEIERRFVRAIG